MGGANSSSLGVLGWSVDGSSLQGGRREHGEADIQQAATPDAGVPAQHWTRAVFGASDNDPTNVGTAAAVGAATGYQLAWLALLVAPLLGVVQTIAAHVGSVARNDLQTLTLKRYGRSVAAVLLVSVVVVNVVTIAADLQAGAAGIGLWPASTPAGWWCRWDWRWSDCLLVGKYDEVVGVLRYLLLGFLAFAAAAFLAHPDWPRLIRSSLVPTLSLHRDVIGGGLALLGTTLTSYVYVWETIERGVEGSARRHDRGPGAGAGQDRRRHRCRLHRGDPVVHARRFGGHPRASITRRSPRHRTPPRRCARSPVRWRQTCSRCGLVVSAVVALPVLMATTAYVVGAQFDWRRGLSEQVSHTPEVSTAS